MKTATDVIELSNKLMEKRESLLSLWQVLAEHFYPERADFTNTRNVGAELSDQLVDSYPILVRRDLANSFGAMLRDGDTWFKMGVEGNSDHMGITRLVQGGVDLETVRRISGHKTLSMVLKYTHISDAHIDDAIDKIGIDLSPPETGTVEPLRRHRRDD